MRRLIVLTLLALLAATPAAAAVRVEAGGIKKGAIAVETGKRVRLVALLDGRAVTEPRAVRGRGRLVLTRAGRRRVACGSGRLRVLAYAVRKPQRKVGKPVGRAARTIKRRCAEKDPVAVDLPDGKTCDQLDPAVCLQPFPSNRFTVRTKKTDTGRRVAFPADAMPATRSGTRVKTAAYRGNDGFSPGSALITRVPGLDSQRALRRTRAVPIDDIGRSYDARQPVVVLDAKTGRRWPVWTEVDVNPEDPAERNLIIRPARNFLEGHRYVVALRRMRTADGKVVRPARAFRALRDGRVTKDRSLEARRRSFESIFRTLARSGVKRDDLFLAWDFTVASERGLSERMLHLRDDAFRQLGDRDLADLEVAGKAPAFTVDRVTNDVDERILRRVEGRVTVPCYLTSAGCATGGTFNNGANGLPAQKPGNVQQARFTCNIPRVAANGTPLRAGIYGHGLLGSRGEVNQDQLRTMSQTHGFVFCATDWSGMACTDNPDPGDPPALYPADCDLSTVAGILTDISTFPRLADRVQQGMLNALFLGRTMIHPQGLGADPAFRIGGKSVLDTTRLYYDGNSQGGIIGGALVAVAPDLDRGALGVTGMNYSTLLRRSVDFNSYATILYATYPDELERPVLLQLLQMLWDRAEANGYAQHMTTDPYRNTPPHEVLMHVGLGDHQVSTYTAKVEARTIGARALAPWAQAGRDSDRKDLFGLPAITGRSYEGSALVLWDSGSPVPPKTEIPPDEGEDPHELPRRSPLAQQQKSAFLRVGGKVTDVCGAAPCFAGDKAGATSRSGRRRAGR